MASLVVMERQEKRCRSVPELEVEDVSEELIRSQSERIGRSRKYEPHLRTINREHAPDRQYVRIRNNRVCASKATSESQNIFMLYDS